jgi:ribosomal protein S18 acetylase RimI-like enzyme
MNVVIETPKIDDFKRVNELAKQVHEIHVNWNPDLFLSVDEVLPKDTFKNLIQNKQIFIAKLENKIVGYVTFSIKEKENPSMRYRKQLNIEAICIDENCRGNGIGTLLLEHIKKTGKEQGCTDMYLTVNQENENAIKVYEKFGFKVKNIAYTMKI